MKSKFITFAGASAVTVAIVIGFLIVRPVLAQVAATSSDPGGTSTVSVDTIASSTPTDASSTPPRDNVSTSTTPAQTAPVDATTTTENNTTGAAQDAPVQSPPAEQRPTGLTEVHIIGTKYTDYFTDGSTTVAFPGDPNIDGNLDKPYPPIPTHKGMTWVHTTGQKLYDTPSGDLDVGDYAVQSDGSFIEHHHPFLSSTSTQAVDSSALAEPKTPSSPATGTPSTAPTTTPPAEPNAPAASLTAPSDTSTRSTTTSLPAGSTSGTSTTHGSTAPDSSASTTIATTTSA
jgi:hypothetical protein